MVLKANTRMSGRIRSELRRRGAWEILATGVRTVLHPVLRHRCRLIWEVKLQPPPPPSVWKPDERLLMIGSENIASEMTPGLREFLGSTSAAAEIKGVMGGDRLFVVAKGTEYLACSYIFFDTTRETRRQARIMGEPRNTPIIGMSFTAPAARGRGLYRRILNEMFRFLASRGFDRAICEVHPDNTPSNKASQAAGMYLYRRLSDWAILERLFLQRVHDASGSRWRIVWVEP
jgi:RimJ/RimL family protein N-acetyltransferase